MVLLVALVSFKTFAATENYDIDPTHTYPTFAVSHLGFSTMYGRFDKTSGTFSIDRAGRQGAVDIIIKTASINTGLEKRDDHLRSPDFFNTIEFPDATYQSGNVKFEGDEPKTIEGKLTLLGVTKPVTLTITAFKCGQNPMNNKAMCGIDAVGSLKRSDFGMKYALPGVGDEIRLMISAEGYKK
ncbi:MAG: YceI family protein [Nitrosomonas sp.]|nr:YceI family protein [Nitrosomonas sp.]